MFKRNKLTDAEQQKLVKHNALEYARSLSDEEWKRFKRAIESYRKSDKILDGTDEDDDLPTPQDFIETPTE